MTEWIDGERWVIQMGWRNGDKWDRVNQWGTAPEAAWTDTDVDVDGRWSLKETQYMKGMTPRRLEECIEKVRNSETADWPQIVWRFVNLRTGEIIPWDAL